MSAILTWEDDSGQTVSITGDISNNESHEGTATITDHPVEEGVNVADHVRVEPETLSVEFYISDKPIISNPGVAEEFNYDSVKLNLPEKPGGAPIFTPGGLTQTVVGAIGDLFGSSPDSATVLRSAEDFKPRTLEAWQKLKDAKDNARLITVTTFLDTYENMVLARIAAPRTAADGSGITLQVDLRRLRIVKSETVAAPEPAEVRGQLAQALGSKSPLAQTDDNAGKKKSLALQIVEGTGLGSALGF